ncbi:hypothetical protein HY642_00030 [Candidatus Woesearchaeota archaeon]|nr:hypothetical protein [Candidatus Woesearchaeota archaeon]
MIKMTRNNQEKLDDLKQQIASCKRIYKRLDGRFETRHSGGQYAEIVKAKPAWKEPRVIIVNQKPLDFTVGDRRIVLDDIFHKLTMEELEHVMPFTLGSHWPEIEADYFAAKTGSIYRYGAYVLGDSDLEVFGHRNGLKEGKLAVAVEYYDFW